MANKTEMKKKIAVQQYTKKSGTTVREHERKVVRRFVADGFTIRTSDPADPLAAPGYLGDVSEMYALDGSGNTVSVSKERVQQLVDELNEANETDREELMIVLLNHELVPTDEEGDVDPEEFEKALEWVPLQQVRNRAYVEEAIRETLRDLNMPNAANAVRVTEFPPGIFHVGWVDYLPSGDYQDVAGESVDQIR